MVAARSFFDTRACLAACYPSPYRTGVSCTAALLSRFPDTSVPLAREAWLPAPSARPWLETWNSNRSLWRHSPIRTPVLALPSSPFPPSTFPNMARCGSRPLPMRATNPREKVNLQLRTIVSTLSRPVSALTPFHSSRNQGRTQKRMHPP